MNEPRATRYQRLRRRAQARGRVASAVALGLIAFTPAGPAIWRAAAGVAGSLPAPAASLAAVVVFTAVICALCGVVAVPSVWYRLREVDTAYGRGSGARRPSLASFLFLVAISAIGAFVVLGSAYVAGDFWWGVAASAFGTSLLAASHLMPRLVATRSTGSLGRPDLERRIADLARRAGVPLLAVQRWTTDEASTAVAMVTGIGSARRVLIAAEVARDWSDDEVVVIVAHELAHHVHRDLERTMVLDAVVIALALLASDGALRLVGDWLGVSGAADPGGLPLIAFVALGLWFAATPMRHALSRRQERRADRWALSWTGQTAAFQTAIRRASARRMVDENPGALTRWLYHRHPPVAERLELAARHARQGE